MLEILPPGRFGEELGSIAHDDRRAELKDSRGLGSRFGRLLTAAAISNLGDGVGGVAFPLLVATLTRDPLQVAGVTFALQLPWFLMAVISGALVDRMDRRRVMVITDLVRGGIVVGLAVAVGAGMVNLPLLYLAAFALGLAETFFDPASEAIVPSLVARDQLATANGRRQAAEFVGNSFAGPPLGAVLFGFMAALPFYFDAATFFVAAALVAALTGSFRAERAVITTLRADVGEGLRWLLRHRVLRTLASMAGITNLFGTAIVSVFVLFAQDILGVSEFGYGVLLTAIGLGGLTGAFVAPLIVRRLGQGTTAQSTILAQAVLAILAGSLSNPYLTGVILFGYGVLITTWNTVSVTLRQSLTPDQLRGRVAGAARLLAWGSQPIGAVLGGVIAKAAGLRAPFFVAAAAWVLLAAGTARIINNRTIDQASAEAVG